MLYRRLQRTGLRISAVGFGTCQFRNVSQQQALDTLRRGFELGVNCIHTAPDYEGAEEIAAQAVRESGRDVIVMSQGFGDAAHFEWLFENARRRFGKQCLELYGIACIDDREYLGENVWGSGGMVEFLLDRKRKGQIGGTFCTTHGSPEYIAKLVRSGVFDAIMLAYNPLGFHLLSYNPAGARELEILPENLRQIFPLAASHGVGLMIMKPLAGGLLVKGKAFPQRSGLTPTGSLTAADVLRSILRHPEVTCVMPGTASVAEAEENARAGWLPAVELDSAAIDAAAAALRSDLCSRCGACDTTCSQHVPVSWLFRDFYINDLPSETFETVDDLQYFHLHPRTEAVCSTCGDVTCVCPVGIDIPETLQRIHGQMSQFAAQGILSEHRAHGGQAIRDGPFPLRIVRREIPSGLMPGERATCRLWIENAGGSIWRAGALALTVVESGRTLAQVALRHDVEPGMRAHFVFEIDGNREPGPHSYAVSLAGTPVLNW